MNKQTTSDKVAATIRRVDIKIQTMAVNEAARTAAYDILAAVVERAIAHQPIDIKQAAAAFNDALAGKPAGFTKLHNIWSRLDDEKRRALVAVALGGAAVP